MDDLDRALLREVQEDATLSLDVLAERVSLSRNACWRRLKALESSGVIDRRVTLLNADKLDLPLTVFMMIRTQAHSPDWLKEFRAATKNMPQIIGVYRMSGDLDYLIRAQVKDMPDYDRLYQALIRRVALSDVSASFVMESIKDTHSLPV